MDFFDRLIRTAMKDYLSVAYDGKNVTMKYVSTVNLKSLEETYKL